MNVVKATRQYEDWLAHRTHLNRKVLRLKHTRMRSSPFSFLRATFYRWAEIWPVECPDLAKAPQVLAVGDLHVENFGTWRDAEGRLIWGVNDFDEAYPVAYPNDLVRLAVSAHLAAQAGHLALKGAEICGAILEGYLEGLKRGGRPFVLGEQNEWLRQIAENDLRDPVRFWRKMDALPAAKGKIPVSAVDAIERLLPSGSQSYRLKSRVSGLGSLGHVRYVAISDWNGGRIAREAKALAPSACSWAARLPALTKTFYQAIMTQAVRCPDPFLQVRGEWIVRRLSPHCSRIELVDLRAQADGNRLLQAMGWETANIHLGTKGAAKLILRHAKKQKEKWLHEATEVMLKKVAADWKTWRKQGQ